MYRAGRFIWLNIKGNKSQNFKNFGDKKILFVSVGLNLFRVFFQERLESPKITNTSLNQRLQFRLHKSS